MNATLPPSNLLVLCLLAACANGQGGADPDMTGENDDTPRLESVPRAAGEPGDAVLPPGGGDKPLGAGMSRLVDVSRQDLAARLGVDPSAIEIVRAEYVTWRDSSLGCPRPGSVAMQVLTNGALIELAAGGQRYRYHSGQNRPPFLCKTPSPIDPLPYAPGES